MSKLRRVATMLPLILMLTAAPAMAAPTQDVPIRGTVTGDDSFVMGDPACSAVPAAGLAYWSYRSEGTGQMSHLGRVSFVVEHCSYMDPATGAGGFTDGTTTFTAANGDTLVLSHEGTFQLAPPLSYVDMTWTVAGGTGRFEGATGSGTANPVSDLVAETTTASFAGRITYDASSKS